MSNYLVEQWLEKKGKKAIIINLTKERSINGTLKGMCEYLGVNYKILTENIEKESNYLILIFTNKGICKELLQSKSIAMCEKYKEEYIAINLLEINLTHKGL